MTRIAFIGLGIMGSPMACHLAQAGYTVIGYNRTATKTEALVRSGGVAVDSIEHAVSDADIVATMLPDTSDVETVLCSTNGVFAHARPGSLIIDFSTIRPDAAKTLARGAAHHDLRMVDAPVSGGEVGAQRATLSVMVGATSAEYNAARPILDVIGKTIVHVGGNGAGQTVKAANQLIVAGTIELVAEAITFLQAYGVDIESGLEVLGGGLAGSTVLQQKAPAMLARNFEPGFRISLHHKDMGIFTAAAREAGVITPLGAAVTQLMAAAVANGDGALDHSGLLRGVERLSGRFDPGISASSAAAVVEITTQAIRHDPETK